MAIAVTRQLCRCIGEINCVPEAVDTTLRVDGISSCFTISDKYFDLNNCIVRLSEIAR